MKKDEVLDMARRMEETSEGLWGCIIDGFGAAPDESLAYECEAAAKAFREIADGMKEEA